ncbi:MAG: ABC transporter permease [Pseudomonadota bacterium]
MTATKGPSRSQRSFGKTGVAGSSAGSSVGASAISLLASLFSGLFPNQAGSSSIVPRSSIAGSALAYLVCIMAFLASLTLGAVSMVSDTAKGWQNDIAQEITIQVPPVEGRDLEVDLETARQIVSAQAGISDVLVIDAAASTALLEPWLGSDMDLSALPVPRLLSVSIDATSPPDFIALKSALAAQVPDASVDNHTLWLDRLSGMADATVLAGLVVFGLMLLATVLTVIFATRGAMAGNSDVIEVLHFVGADRSYIAQQFQKHFLILALKGSAVGAVNALLVFLFAGWWSQAALSDPRSDQMSAFFGSFSVGLSGYIGTVLLVFVIAFLAALTSRLTVMRHVGTLDGSAKR